jgi:hypothetical protein
VDHNGPLRPKFLAEMLDAAKSTNFLKFTAESDRKNREMSYDLNK